MRNSNKLQITPSKLEASYSHSRGRYQNQQQNQQNHHNQNNPSAYLQDLIKRTYQQSHHLLRKRQEPKPQQKRPKPHNYISNNYFIKNVKIEHPYHSLEPKRRYDLHSRTVDLKSRSVDLKKKTLWNKSFEQIVKPSSALNIPKKVISDMKHRSHQSLHLQTSHRESQLNLLYSVRSRQGVLASNPNKVNQDAFICEINLTEHPNTHMFSVCDGHGTNGSLVSNFVKQHLPRKFKAVPLSEDHKPQLIKEKQRIIASGGRVDSYYDEEGRPIGPQRVWVQNANYPGLAMSRSIGDQVAASVGVSWKPGNPENTINFGQKSKSSSSPNLTNSSQPPQTVSGNSLKTKQQMIWINVNRRKKCVDLVGKHYEKNNIEKASDELMRLAYSKWTSEDDSVIDDITFIIIFINDEF